MRNRLLGILLLLPLPAVADGASLFAVHCATCHGEGGTGIPGIAPRLDRPAFWDALGEDAPAYIAGVMVSGLAGRIEAGGQVYAGLIMPPQAVLSDAVLSEIGSWVLQRFGGATAEVTPAHVAETRAARPSQADLLSMRPGQ